MASTISHERLLELVHYDPETGAFIARVARPSHVRAGQRLGTLTKQGYLQCDLLGRKYLLHRLAWFYMTGEWVPEIDHRNRKKADNRWRNLREATRSQNKANEAGRGGGTGLRGVYLRRTKAGASRYLAQITFQGETVCLGTFGAPDVAYAAYVAAARVVHGQFAEHL